MAGFDPKAPPPDIRRMKFIRRAAIEIFLSHSLPSDLIAKQRMAETAWSDARRLWDAKPEDC